MFYIEKRTNKEKKDTQWGITDTELLRFYWFGPNKDFIVKCVVPLLKDKNNTFKDQRTTLSYWDLSKTTYMGSYSTTTTTTKSLPEV